MRARIPATPPSIDGRLSDEVWPLAEVGTGLTQRDPDNGQPMTDDTRVQIAYDDRFLYVAVSASTRTPAESRPGSDGAMKLRQPTRSRSASTPRHDHQTALQLLHQSVRMAGRFHLLRRHERPRLQRGLGRAQPRSPTRAGPRSSAFRSRRCASPPRRSRAGVGLQRPAADPPQERERDLGAEAARRTRRGVALRTPGLRSAHLRPAPARADSLHARARRVPPARAEEGGASAGLDARVGLGTGATLSATFNPDFGQVEQDPPC